MCAVNEENCNEENINSSAIMYLPIFLFFLSQCCEGVSSSFFYTIGNTYLDDNVEKKKYPLYYGNLY